MLRRKPMEPKSGRRAVAQTSPPPDGFAAANKSAVSRVSKPAGRSISRIAPIWKSAIQQVWKTALQYWGRLGLLDAICHCPIMHLVKPDMVLEVAFNSIQPSTRHVSGLALRFLRIKAIRCDKNVDSIDTLRYARDLAQQRANLPRF
jgi:hypothetical protein